MLKVLCFLIGFLCVLAFPSYAGNALPDGVSASTDKEEWGVSMTKVKLSADNGIVKAVYSVPAPAKKYAYASVNLPLKSLPDGKSKSIHFDLRCSDGAVLPSSIAISAADGRKSKLYMPRNRKALSTWQSFSFSLADFSLTPEETDSLDHLGFSLAVTRPGENDFAGTVEFRNVVVSDELVEPTVKVPDYSFLIDKKVKETVKGHSAWIYEESQNQIDRIIEYNKNSAVPIRILFAYASSVDFKNGTWRVADLQESRMKWFREHLPENVEIHANIDSGDGVRLSKESPEVQEELGRELAEKINECPYVQGVHTDIEPYKTGALPFYIALKKYCKKPVGAALGDWDLHILRIMDYPVLMGYDLSNSPAGLYRTALRRYNSFAKDCSYVESFYSIGLPFIATMGEYEYEENRKTGERSYSGYKMPEFIDSAFRAFQECKLLDDKYFMGVAIWGFVNEKKKGVGIPSKECGYYPHIIQNECFDKLRELKYR